MAEQKKQNYVRTTTPKGKASYPWLNKPDTKFDVDGVFKCNLIVPKKEAAALIKMIDEEIKKAVAAVKAENPKAAKSIKEGDKPYAMETNDEGDETGNVIFKTKQRAKITTKKGEVIDKTIPLFDAKGKKIEANVGGGSVLKLNIELAHYYVAAQKSAGVSLRLQAAQIIELVEFGSGGTASSYGFGAEEGYEGDEAPKKTTKKATDAETSTEDEAPGEDDDIF
jgi:hypothetical protein